MDKPLPGRTRMSPNRNSSPTYGTPPSLTRPRASTLGRVPGKPPSLDSSVTDLSQKYETIGGSDPPQETQKYSKPETKVNENVTVTVRFRPLSLREIQRGDDVGWYADGENIVRMESNPDVAYAYDKVFGPATTTRAVYDKAAQPIVNDAMDGMNGTVFAYGVTSSGKTHTMHGDQKSPGVIPLAVKEVFSIIQETPGRQFLLRVSYLEIYNEVINDLLNPESQNLRIREDPQMGTYVEGIKEEVVLSPAHALSLVAAGEEHRHVGSTNFNAISSRSHTIFRMTIESTGVDKQGFEEVSLSHLNLIDLAGSESSKAGTSGVRRKEGGYINKSLLTLGTVIAKLSEGKQSHIPYRDSKLTRLLQSSLSGNGRISLICTVTPASGTLEETHNTLKFAQRAKHVEVRAEHNRILDEKSLIKKYQKEISELKLELLRLRSQGGHVGKAGAPASEADLALLKEKFELDQQLMQSRLEEEEQAKAALMARIQRLTKLILVSTKAQQEPPQKQTELRRRLSFGEEDLMYLKLRKMDNAEDEDDASDDSGMLEESEEKRLKRRSSVLSWLMMKRTGSEGGSGLETPGTGTQSPGGGSVSGALNHSSSAGALSASLGSPGSAGGPPGSTTPPPVPGSGPGSASGAGSSSGKSLWPVSPTRTQSLRESSDGGLPLAIGRRMLHGGSPARSRAGDPPSRAESVADSVATSVAVTQTTQAGDLFSLLARPKRLSAGEVSEHIELLKEQAKILSGEVALANSSLKRLIEYKPESEESNKERQKLEDEIKEKSQQIKILEQKIQDARQLHQAYASPEEMAKVIAKLKALLSEKTFDMEIINTDNHILQDSLAAKTAQNNKLLEEINMLRVELTRAYSNNHTKSIASGPSETTAASVEKEAENSNVVQLQSKLQSAVQERDVLLAQQKQLTKDLAEARAVAVMRPGQDNNKQLAAQGYQDSSAMDALASLSKLKEELAASAQREKNLRQALTNMEAAQIEKKAAGKSPVGREDEAAGSEEERRRKAFEEALSSRREEIAGLRKEMEAGRKREAELENDLATMWVLVAELRRHSGVMASPGGSPAGKQAARGAEVQKQMAEAQQRISLLEAELAHLKGEYVEGLPVESLEQLASLHRQALTKLTLTLHKIKQSDEPLDDFKPSSLCRNCFERSISTRLDPCHHAALCKNCAEACNTCPTCLGSVSGWQATGDN